MWDCRDGRDRFGQCRTSSGRRVAGQDGPDGGLEEAGDGADFRPPAESRWRRPRGPRAAMAASNVRSWSTSSNPTATGRTILGGRISWPGISARTSQWRASPITRSASAIASGSAAPSSRSASHATPATGSASGWNDPEMPALLVAHHRPGFYFRVIQEGEIGAGDRIEKLSDGPERMTVAEIDALLYSAEHPLEALRRAVRIPALSLDWQGSMQALLAAAEAGGTTGNAGLGPGASAPLAWRGFRPVVVVASREESADVRSFEFAAEDGSPLPPALPGQYIMVRVRPSPDAPAVTRSYSLCGPPGTPNYRIGVKNERGLASGFLHQSVRAGSRLEVSAPRGSFTLADGATPVVLISAGVGVTPMLAMLHGAAATNAVTSRPVWWLHSARDRAHHSFAKEADDLLVALRASHRCVIYSRPAPGDMLGQDFDRPGHLSLAAAPRVSGFPRTPISTCVVRPAFSRISRKAWRHGAFPGPGSTSKCSGLRPLSRRASPASPQPCRIVLTVLRAADPW